MPHVYSFLREGDFTMIHTGKEASKDGTEEGVKMLALKVGVTWPQAKEHWQPPEAGRGRERSLP